MRIFSLLSVVCHELLAKKSTRRIPEPVQPDLQAVNAK